MAREVASDARDCQMSRNLKIAGQSNEFRKPPNHVQDAYPVSFSGGTNEKKERSVRIR